MNRFGTQATPVRRATGEAGAGVTTTDHEEPSNVIVSGRIRPDIASSPTARQ
jgi:hypothetical protein